MHAAAPQLVRVETCKNASGKEGSEATEIQHIQLCDGDPPRGMGIPIYMLFPRLFVCPTVTTDSYRVEFEMNLIIKFENGYMITENFQISIYRPLEV